MVECQVNADNFNEGYRTPVVYRFRDGSVDAQCKIECSPAVRYLEFAVWIDQTFKLVATS